MRHEQLRPDDPRADTELWALVSAVPVPPAGEDFVPRLFTRLARRRVLGLSEAATVESSGARAKRRRGFRVRLLVAAATISAAVVVAVAVLAALQGANTATAADMMVSMSAGAEARAVHLEFEEGYVRTFEEETPPVFLRTATEDLVLSVTGDYRGRLRQYMEGTIRPSEVDNFGYDFRRRELRSTENGDSLQVLRPAWPTGQSSTPSEYIDYQAAAASVRALLAETDPATPVSETTYLGRPAWRATLESPGLPSPGMSVVVDKATGLLLEIRQPAGMDGAFAWQVLRVTRFETDPPLHPGWQVVPLPKKPTGDHTWIGFRDEGTRFGSPEAVAKRSWPTLPLIPTSVPDGYRRAGVANAVWWEVREKHMNDDPWKWKTEIVRRPGRKPGLSITKRLALGGCPQGVLVLFRRGFQSFTVEISPRLPGEPGLGKLRWDESVTAKDTVLTGGYLKGARARTWISSATLPVTHLYPNSMSIAEQGPTLLAYSDRSLIAIYGDLTRQELIDVANSLQVYGDVHRPLPADYMK
jgi:hypothetical protein